ncbi:MAG: hypothetical protein AB3N06_01435 [Erythrobacter sp.]
MRGWIASASITVLVMSLAACNPWEVFKSESPRCGDFSYSAIQLPGAKDVIFMELKSRDISLLNRITKCFEANRPIESGGGLIFDGHRIESDGSQIFQASVEGVTHSEFFVIVDKGGAIKGAYSVRFDD